MTYPTGLFQEIEEAKKQQLENVRMELLELTKKVLSEVFSEIQAEEVYITGSLLLPFRFGKASDIDIAVKGLRNEDYFPVLARLEELLSRRVEIIELENCRFSEKIIKFGIKIK